MTSDTSQLLQPVCELALAAGNSILEIYGRDRIDVDFKSDNSPLTEADRRSNDIICNGLKKIAPSLPILSEENKEIPYATRRQWHTFWLVDPLDGTKEFINRRDEFTVNIALIEGGRPILGVVLAPALHTMYFGEKDNGAWKSVRNGQAGRISIRTGAVSLTAVASRSHRSPEEDKLFSEIGIQETISKGSSLKFCLVAEGHADIYYRHGPTSEWDTAAGQCVVECAGGKVFERTGPLLYNKNSLLNPSFIAKGDPGLQVNF